MTDLTLRPVTPDDLPFLRRLYASTREDELAHVPWAPEQREAFLDQQFDAQHRYYQANYAGASFDVIVEGGEPIGRLYVDRGPEEIRVMDIALLPETRGRGLGTRLLEGLLREGEAAGLPVTIHVEKYNPALRLYRRLGFREADDRGVYWFMEWRPGADRAGSAVSDRPETAGG